MKDLIIKQLAYFLDRQDRLNQLLNEDWIDAGYHYGRAIAMEAAEAMDHVTWKWWKHDQPNLSAAQLEIIDIWHFWLSDQLIQHSHYGSLAGIVANIMHHSQGTPTAYADKCQSLDVLMTAASREIPLDVIVGVMMTFDIDFEQLSKWYLGKYCLNVFRWDNGYRDGTYIKDWYGVEDNDVLLGYIDQIQNFTERFQSDPDLLEADIKAFLTREYLKVTAQSEKDELELPPNEAWMAEVEDIFNKVKKPDLQSGGVLTCPPCRTQWGAIIPECFYDLVDLIESCDELDEDSFTFNFPPNGSQSTPIYGPAKITGLADYTIVLAEDEVLTDIGTDPTVMTFGDYVKSRNETPVALMPVEGGFPRLMGTRYHVTLDDLAELSKVTDYIEGPMAIKCSSGVISIVDDELVGLHRFAKSKEAYHLGLESVGKLPLTLLDEIKDYGLLKLTLGLELVTKVDDHQELEVVLQPEEDGSFILCYQGETLREGIGAAEAMAALKSWLSKSKCVTLRVTDVNLINYAIVRSREGMYAYPDLIEADALPYPNDSRVPHLVIEAKAESVGKDLDRLKNLIRERKLYRMVIPEGKYLMIGQSAIIKPAAHGAYILRNKHGHDRVLSSTTLAASYTDLLMIGIEVTLEVE